MVALCQRVELASKVISFRKRMVERQRPLSIYLSDYYLISNPISVKREVCFVMCFQDQNLLSTYFF